MGHRWVAWCIVSTLASSAPQGGSIAGVITPPAEARSIAAVHRETGRRTPATIDAATGRFVIDGLAPGATYDLVIDVEGGRLEGIDLSVPRSDYEEEQPFSDEDVKTLTRTVKSLNKFEDDVQILAIRGNIQHAAILLNKVRRRPFYNSKADEVVWRAELWRFEKPEETWVKVQDELFTILYRERIPRADYDKKAITFDPALGGLRPTPENPRIDVGRVDLPPKKPGIRVRGEAK